MENFVVETNRAQKAGKIIAVVEDYLNKPLHNLKILDIGCGNGLIASYLADYGNTVSAVDVVDQRDLSSYNNYDFTLITDEKLPFPDAFFDMVISNHVIEHVNNHDLHLQEIRRVLKSGGICYFATPNRYFPYEVHYKVPFLHWLPKKLFVKSLKTIGKYSYPVRLLGYIGLIRKFKPIFTPVEYTHKIIKNPAKFAFEKLPVWFSKLYCPMLNIISPTLIFVLQKKA